jgi:lysozyme family protein
MTTFDKALTFTLKWEGGFSNHSADPGGATMKGVTQRVYDSYRKHRGQSLQSVRNITDQELHQIYLDGYWTAAFCDKLPERLAIAAFDFAVNAGAQTAVKNLQRALGIDQDGIVGANTLRTIQAKGEPEALRLYLKRRADRFRNLASDRPSLKVFLKGWLNRVNDMERYLA